MRILENHANFMEFEPLAKAVKDAEECEKVRRRYENVLVVFTSVEEDDDESVAREAVAKIIEDMKRVGADRILIYPYAHLTSNLAKPEKAKELLKKMELFAREQKVEVHRAPFGWYKTFTLSCKGHPLAELSRSFERGEAVERRERRVLDEMKKFYSEMARKLGEERVKELDTASHILAFAVKKVFPQAKLGLGSPGLDEFYCDFELKEISMEDLDRVESEMKRIIEGKHELETEVISKERAREIFKDEKYKLELIEEIPADAVRVCKIDNFVDICENPHVKLEKIKAVKLLKLGGAYWKGDPTKPMLKRIHGVAFSSEKKLADFLKLRKEAEKRDHRKIGKQLDLFSFHEESPGIVFFHPNGMIIWNALMDFWRREHQKAGYLEVKTPIILERELWERSGHWEHYRENMYFTKVDERDFAIKPMNCPGAILVYRTKQRSYRELPLRLAEVGLVHRHELSGVLCGLFRVRAFTQDDAHIFCTPEQLKDEIKNIIEMCIRFYKLFGFDFRVELSTRPERSIGTDEMWESAESALKEALNEAGMKYKLNPGEGAFYGPKVDFHLADCLGRSWQCGTIQVDFAMPERFDLTYVGKDGREQRPVMIHRVIFGSVERFLGILVEHYAGAFPTWLSPVQVIVIPLSEKYVDYGRRVLSEFLKKNVRAEIDESAATVEYKIRDAQLRKIPYMIVVGEREAKSNKIAVRRRDGEVKYDVGIDEFLRKLLEEIGERRLELSVQAKLP